jgi:hypothetical protein
VTFAPDDKVTVIANPQCHGTVLESDEAYTNVKMDNFSFTILFRTDELKLREIKK